MPHLPHTQFTVYAGDTTLLSQSWRPETAFRRPSHVVTTLLKYFSTWKLWLNTHKTETILFSKLHPPPLPSGPHNFVPWASAVRYLSLVLDSKRLYTQHWHTVANKAIAVLCNLFLLAAADSTLTKSNKLTTYKLLIRSILTYGPCLQFHISLKQPHTPSYPVQLSPNHR
jgi:hypothetical protein